ncbi:MAG: hypothetical protein O3A92_03685 [Verrucomicrobia bacterium]|nr:hypothetical protein [Verrucomicrobiota bacterium]
MPRRRAVSERGHLPGREGCPHLPMVEALWTAREMAGHRGSHGAGFYVAALSFAQSLWLEGKPAQALLQMNKALMADLSGGEPELREWPLPYAAKVWVMREAGEGEFLGNPVRHYQHLATRMSGPRAELRRWRAWACLYLAEGALGREGFPRDGEQIAKAGVVVPEGAEVVERLDELGLPGEAEMVVGVMGGKDQGGGEGKQ